jgi:16S rRNA (cytidine1402-2'-O)-methyltransferase
MDDGAGGHTYAVGGHRIAAPRLEPGLYLVATPIGNLGDMTLRALATLAAADVVVCEDTRVTAVLLRRYGIGKKCLAYHDHNAARERPKLLAALAAGKSVALVSDAGTPLVSDPGYRLALEARAAGHSVIPVPGASAVLAALLAAGLPTDSFLFAGFLPARSGARASRLAALRTVPATLVFFESPKRLAASLAAMAGAFGAGRQAAIARELTKAYETVRGGALGELASALADEPPPKGEVVVVVGPPLDEPASAEEADRLLAAALTRGPIGKAAADVAAVTGLPRRHLYQRALALKGRGDDERG